MPATGPMLPPGSVPHEYTSLFDSIRGRRDLAPQTQVRDLLAHHIDEASVARILSVLGEDKEALSEDEFYIAVGLWALMQRGHDATINHVMLCAQENRLPVPDTKAFNYANIPADLAQLRLVPDAQWTGELDSVQSPNAWVPSPVDPQSQDWASASPTAPAAVPPAWPDTSRNVFQDIAHIDQSFAKIKAKSSAAEAGLAVPADSHTWSANGPYANDLSFASSNHTFLHGGSTASDDHDIPTPQDIFASDTDDEWAWPPASDFGFSLNVVVSPRLDLSGGLLRKFRTWYITLPHTTTIVERRYSDFYWLMEFLNKRYPCRLLPILPPKKLQLASDAHFIHRRRLGLQRYVAFLISHPTLKCDPVVAAFLTHHGSWAQWLKDNSASLDQSSDEASLNGATLLPHQLARLPDHDLLENRLHVLHANLKVIIQHWSAIIAAAERIRRRRDQDAQDLAHMASSLAAANAVQSTASWLKSNDTEAAAALQDSFVAHLTDTSTHYANSATDASSTLVDGLRRYGELFVSLRELLLRYSAFVAADGLPSLAMRRAALLKRREAVAGPAIEKIDAQLAHNDAQLAHISKKRNYNRFTLWSEIIFLFRSSMLFSAVVSNLEEADKAFFTLLADAATAFIS